MIIIYHIIVDSSGSGSGLISILRPLLLPSRYYLCVSLPRQYINYLTTTICTTGISNNPSNKFRYCYLSRSATSGSRRHLRLDIALVIGVYLCVLLAVSNMLSPVFSSSPSSECAVCNCVC